MVYAYRPDWIYDLGKCLDLLNLTKKYQKSQSSVGGCTL